MYNSDTTETQAPLYCANHPNVETYLRCAKCEKPICARCRVSTPIGFRCFDCANLDVLPTYAISTDYYVKAMLFGIVAATISAIFIGFVPLFEFWGAVFMGITVPEAVAAAANQKRGPGLQRVAVACVVAGFVLSRVIMEVFNTAGRFANPPFLEDIPVYLTQYSILWLILAVFLAYRRLQ